METKEKKTRKLEGTVVSNKMQKTVVVAVVKTKVHPKYRKYYKSTNRFKAHSGDKEYKLGEHVTIEETNPISKEKRWRVVDKEI